MEDRRWDYTRLVIEQSKPRPEVDPLEDDEALAAGNSLLRSLLAAAPADGWLDAGSGPGYS